MTDIQKLRALAEAATPGPWGAGGNWVSTLHGASIADCARGDQHFIAAANPAAVIELIAEVERGERMLVAACVSLGGINEALGADMDSDADELIGMIGELKAENEDLRKIISDSATSCGAAVSVECSLDFMAHLPAEIFSVISRLRNALNDCSDSLHGEMLQKFGGQMPDDMHPVTRREYDRDMAEVAEYRAALGKEAQQ